MTTISSSSHIDTKLEKKNFLHVMRTLDIYSLNKFHIQHTAVLTLFIMLFPSSYLSYN